MSETVPATTHQRTLEALREARVALECIHNTWPGTPQGNAAADALAAMGEREAVLSGYGDYTPVTVRAGTVASPRPEAVEEIAAIAESLRQAYPMEASRILILLGKAQSAAIRTKAEGGATDLNDEGSWWWAPHVPMAFVEIWGTFSPEQRKVIKEWAIGKAEIAEQAGRSTEESKG